MLRNVLLLITGTKRKCKTKTFRVYDENGEENASFDVRDLTTIQFNSILFTLITTKYSIFCRKKKN